MRMDYDNSASYGMPENLFTSLKDVFEAIMVNSSRTGVLSPSKLVEVLKRDNESFRGNMHQDAHEFFNVLLNTVSETIDADTKQKREQAQEARQIEVMPRAGSAHANGHAIPPSPDSTLLPVSPTKVTFQTPTSPVSHEQDRWIHDIFEGLLTSETQCLTCENVSQRDEPFLDLSVDLEEHSSVTACLRKFSAEEMLCERNKFHCDNCGGLQEAEKRMKLKRLPPVLALHLKRFKYTEDFTRLQKLFHRVVYPFHLRLFNTTNDVDDPDKLYELYAVVVHIGAGAYQGHYVSIIKTKDQGWLLFDDELVEPVPKEFVQNFFGDKPGSACAYVLFYQETTLEAVKREQAMEARAAAAAAKPDATTMPTVYERDSAGGLGLNLKGIYSNGHLVRTSAKTPTSPHGNEGMLDPLVRSATANPIMTPNSLVDAYHVMSPIRSSPSAAAPSLLVGRVVSEPTIGPAVSNLPSLNDVSPSNYPSAAPGPLTSSTVPNSLPTTLGRSNTLRDRFRRNSKPQRSPSGSSFWGSLDLSKEGKSRDKDNEKQAEIERANQKERDKENQSQREHLIPRAPQPPQPVTRDTFREDLAKQQSAAGAGTERPSSQGQDSAIAEDGAHISGDSAQDNEPEGSAAAGGSANGNGKVKEKEKKKHRFSSIRKAASGLRRSVSKGDVLE